MLKVNVPVQIKLILTEQTKQGITAEINGAIQQVQNELDQLEFQGRKALQDAEQHGPQAVQQVTMGIERERGARLERREQMMQQLVHIQQTPIGEEVSGGQMETSVEVRVGDMFDDMVRNLEIVLRDGVVTEIRGARQG